MTPSRVAVFALIAFALGCSRPPPAPLAHDAYVWQRVWTPSLREAMGEARESFGAYRILALHSERNGALQTIAVDASAMAQIGLPVVAVVRLDGGDAEIAPERLAPALRDVVAQWRSAGAIVRGVEIDHDCATSKLPAYANQLRDLKARIAGDLRLSITALPAWLAASALPAVLAEADEAVLQVHAVRNPAQGLFDADLAARWVRDFAEKTSKPFRVAVPDYGSRVSFDADDAVLDVESETPPAATGRRAEEWRAEPADVARLLTLLRETLPPHLAGIVWFRLPVPEDRRSWSLATLKAVIAGRPLRPELGLMQRRAENGATDLRVVNRGEIDARLPSSIHVTARRCLSADAMHGFIATADADGWQFRAIEKEILRAGRERPIGWVHCAQVDGVEWHADP